jgi:hypothetical protein
LFKLVYRAVQLLARLLAFSPARLALLVHKALQVLLARLD